MAAGRTARRRVLREKVDVRCLRAPVALLGLVLDLGALVQRAVARTLNGAEVHEQVLAAFVRGDEPVTLVGVEPLDGSSCHMSFTSLPTSLNGQEGCKPAPSSTRSNCRTE